MLILKSWSKFEMRLFYSLSLPFTNRTDDCFTEEKSLPNIWIIKLLNVIVAKVKFRGNEWKRLIFRSFYCSHQIWLLKWFGHFWCSCLIAETHPPCSGSYFSEGVLPDPDSLLSLSAQLRHIRAAEAACVPCVESVFKS